MAHERDLEVRASFWRLGPWIPGFLEVRALDPWILGSKDPWILGSLDPWVLGSLDPWIPGSLDPWVRGSADPWLPGSLGPGILGSWALPSRGPARDPRVVLDVTRGPGVQGRTPRGLGT